MWQKIIEQEQKIFDDERERKMDECIKLLEDGKAYIKNYPNGYSEIILKIEKDYLKEELNRRNYE